MPHKDQHARATRNEAAAAQASTAGGTHQTLVE